MGLLVNFCLKVHSVASIARRHRFTETKLFKPLSV